MTLSDSLWYIVVLSGAYCVGAIPTGFLIARVRGITDITRHGSGNIGATNVARVLGRSYFFIVFLLDACKAYAYLVHTKPFFLCKEAYFLVALCLLIGNGFSLFLSFKGGKGFATTCGIIGALDGSVLVGMLSIWALVFVATKTVGKASVCALVCLPIVAYLCAAEPSVSFMGMICCLGGIGLWLHRSNIRQYRWG